MIDKINQEIEDLETKWEKLRKSSEGKPLNTTIYVQFRATEEKLEQAKKDKKIIEERLEDLKQKIIDINKPLDRDTYLRNILREINQKLKNQNGKQRKRQIRQKK